MVLFCGQLSDITLAAIRIPSSKPSAFASGSTSGYLSWPLCCFPALSHPAEIVPQTFLLAKLAAAMRGAVNGHGAEKLGLWSVSLLHQNLTQMHVVPKRERTGSDIYETKL